jgi:urease accessory protein
MRTLNYLAGFVATLLVPALAYGHPGHGSATNQSGLSHYVTEPVHISGIVVVGLIAALTICGLLIWKNGFARWSQNRV